jgi:hypothetical protein
MNQWVGIFESTQYGSALVHGKVKTLLPEDLLDLEGERFAFEMQYDGLFRKNLKLAMEASYNNGEFIAHIYPFQSVVFQVKQMSDTLISGTYISKQPDDIGMFIIKRE